jgi:hypothetical protein
MREPLSVTLLLLTLSSTASADTPFAIETADGSPNEVGAYTSLALDASGNPHVSYFDNTNNDLKYARKSGGVWTIETADGAGSVGEYTSLALDASGNPHISYFNISNEDIKYARKSGGVWTIETPVSSLKDLAYTSLALDASGNPHISYYDHTSTDLEYARKSGAFWTRQTVDGSSSSVGLEPSLAVDASGNPHISYYDLTNGNLKYAHKSAGVWVIETADGAASNTGRFTSLALDASGNPHVSYYDLTFGDLKYARKSGGVWVIETADGSSSGFYTSLALDASENPHVSYHDVTNGNLKYARKLGGLWVIETPDEAGNVGEHCSLALDASGNPHVSYFDDTNDNLKYAMAIPWTSMWRAETDVFPDTHCPWVLSDTADPEAPVLTDDLLTLATSNSAENLYYEQSDFLAVPEFLIISARLRVVSESHLEGNPRRGVGIEFAVDADSANFLWVGRDTVFLWDAFAHQGATAFVDTDDSLHTYDIKVVNQTDITVHQDGVPILSGAIVGTGGNILMPTLAWGDLTLSSAAVSEWAFFMHNANTVECGTTVDVARRPYGDGSPITLSVYPNPTQGMITLAIRAAASRGDLTRVTIFDVGGRHVRSLEAGPVQLGLTQLSWDGRDNRGRALSSGVYLLQLESAGQVIASSKATILR